MTTEIKEKLANAMEGADPEDVRRMMVAFAQWEFLREHGAKERKRVNELVASRLAQFKEAMEVGTSNTNDQVLKCSVVEQRWQDLEDSRAEKKEINSTMRDQIKSAEQKIRDLIAEAKGGQMSLFGKDRVPTIDFPPTPEDDEEEDETKSDIDDALDEAARLMAEADAKDAEGASA